MLVVNPSHWLDENGKILAGPARLRRNAIRVARLVEYGGPLDSGTARETLVPCGQRRDGRKCPGFLWVTKLEDDNILAFCAVCRTEQVLVRDWQATIWAEGPMDPVPVDLLPTD